jgi:hypothetical protein
MVILNSYVKLPEGNSQMHQMPSRNRCTIPDWGVMAYQAPSHGWLMGWCKWPLFFVYHITIWIIVTCI